MLSRNNYGLDLFDEFFKDPFFRTQYKDSKDKPMRTDIYETSDMYLLEIELPGFSGMTFRQSLKRGILQSLLISLNVSTRAASARSLFIRNVTTAPIREAFMSAMSFTRKTSRPLSATVS